ncbi:MAG: MbnP family protein [Bacteroidota bacterium]
MREKLQLLFCLLLGSFSVLTAQTNVTLNIHHLLGEQNFRLYTLATNNLGNEFDFSRLEYYLAEISLIHDGGQETMIEDRYILVDGAFATSEDLGAFDITNLEAIRFHIGVDAARNYSDPATYDMDHPLAPQFPSMHWGWVSGYRFLAIEGKSGANLGEVWQIHALLEENYHQTEVLIDRTAVDGQLTIDLDADYLRGLDNIDLDDGVISHGGFGDAKVAIENYRDYVFTASDNITNTQDLVVADERFSITPNLITRGQSPQFLVENPQSITYEVQVTGANGQVLSGVQRIAVDEQVMMPNLQAGIYFLRIYKAGVFVAAKQFIVQ